MISKSHKFPLRTEFVSFRARARQSTTTHLRLLVLAHTPSRLAVIVPKKVSKLATTRNWLKRLTYDSAWPLIKDKNLDAVVIYKPLTLKKNIQIKAEIVHELSQIIGNL